MLRKIHTWHLRWLCTSEIHNCDINHYTYYECLTALDERCVKYIKAMWLCTSARFINGGINQVGINEMPFSMSQILFIIVHFHKQAVAKHFEVKFTEIRHLKHQRTLVPVSLIFSWMCDLHTLYLILVIPPVNAKCCKWHNTPQNMHSIINSA